MIPTILQHAEARHRQLCRALRAPTYWRVLSMPMVMVAVAPSGELALVGLPSNGTAMSPLALRIGRPSIQRSH